jgi:hypothetical protein
MRGDKASDLPLENGTEFRDRRSGLRDTFTGKRRPVPLPNAFSGRRRWLAFRKVGPSDRERRPAVFWRA